MGKLNNNQDQNGHYLTENDPCDILCHVIYARLIDEMVSCRSEAQPAAQSN